MISTQVDVQKGFWTYFCCGEDLHQITTDEEVTSLKERLAAEDDGTLKDKVFPTLSAAVRSLIEAALEDAHATEKG